MTDLTRRRFTLLAGAGLALGTGILPTPRVRAQASPDARVVVVGGGFAGATFAHYLKRAAPGAAVTLVDPATPYVTCPFSNTVIGGFNRMEEITVGREGLARAGIQVIPRRAERIDPAAKSVTLAGGDVLQADILVVAPGIDFATDGIENYTSDTTERMPHAWKAGDQTRLLRAQLEAMPDGGRVIIAVPPAPYRCPPGPFERASLIAHELSRTKPRSKVLILDATEAMPKGDLFQQGWDALYPGMIERIVTTPAGWVTGVEPARLTLRTDFENHTGDVINLIPPQRAGRVATEADLADTTGWCPVDAATFESTRHPGVHVLGDAARTALPKSASAGNSAAKVCAHAVAARLTGRDFGPAAFINACYSLLAPDYGIAVAAVYDLKSGGIRAIDEASGSSPLDAKREYRRKEAEDAQGWYASITADTFG
ncbi:Sulfide dehydrogenase [flavocytochrome C] flavoprotein chain precursor [Caenispirillum salinarum AK4]|uniref:Sulfide dehydrogenase [flavocytochrome C] flavoprotein chain n=1 Tax=Caenispirillum salinarum AK4 TaxID=1238182 RepID=K9GSB9_9PROT|nr:NAD(P)/FAD-dependent oxidoreductase [Caenispirillum salinarum]EKV28890.1 Sulfide dehydrogenase [flavocytochrome C] flavoprotein chain precursor [Caenispirillum salinarum AK4]